MSRPRTLPTRPTAARRWSSALLVLVTGALLLLAPAPAQAATFSGSLAQAVAAVPTAAEANSGYDRTLFRHWVDANGDCQDARAEVLISEAESDTPLTYTTSSRCTVSTGRWFSYYDRVSWTLSSDVDIDHMVPLAEAWGSGASGWTSANWSESSPSCCAACCARTCGWRLTTAATCPWCWPTSPSWRRR